MATEVPSRRLLLIPHVDLSDMAGFGSLLARILADAGSSDLPTVSPITTYQPRVVQGLSVLGATLRESLEMPDDTFQCVGCREPLAFPFRCSECAAMYCLSCYGSLVVEKCANRCPEGKLRFDRKTHELLCRVFPQRVQEMKALSRTQVFRETFLARLHGWKHNRTASICMDECKVPPVHQAATIEYLWRCALGERDEAQREFKSGLVFTSDGNPSVSGQGYAGTVPVVFNCSGVYMTFVLPTVEVTCKEEIEVPPTPPSALVSCSAASLLTVPDSEDELDEADVIEPASKIRKIYQ